MARYTVSVFVPTDNCLVFQNSRLVISFSKLAQLVNDVF
jgi:hypothetical protein